MLGYNWIVADCHWYPVVGNYPMKRAFVLLKESPEQVYYRTGA